MATIAENIQTLRSIKSDIKNAITDKGGSVGNDFKTYAQAITNLPSGGGGGGTEIEDAFVTRTISGTYSNDRVSVVGDYAFGHCSKLKSIFLPNCKSINHNAFNACKALTFISLPLCEYIGNVAFGACTNLAQVYLNSVSIVTSIYPMTFSKCPNLISVYVPASLVDAFKTSEYWSSISNKIVAYGSDIAPEE